MVDPNSPENRSINKTSEIDQLKKEVTDQTAKEIREEFLGKASQASEVNNILLYSLRGRGLIEDFKGKIDDKDSAKGKAHDIKKVVQKILLSAGDPSKIPIPEGKPQNVQSLTRSLIEKISSRIGVHELTEQTAPLIYNLFHSALSGEITNIDSLANEFKKLELLFYFNPHLYQELQKSLIDVAREQGLNEEQAKEKFPARAMGEAGDEGGGAFDRNSTESAFFEGPDELDPENKEFFKHLNSIESFEKYTKKIIERFRNPDDPISKKMRARNPDFDRLTHHEQDDAIAESLSYYLQERIESTVLSIFYTILESDKEMDFQSRASKGRNWMISPELLFQSFSQKVKGLSKPVKGGYEFDHKLLHMLRKPKRVRVDNMIDPETGRRLPSFNKVLSELEPAHEIHHFLGYLGEFADSEYKRLSFGYNLEFLGTKMHFKHEDGVMKTIGGFAAGLSNAEIDEMYTGPQAKIIQAAVSMFDQNNEQFFRQENWMKKPILVDKFYQNLINFRKKAEDELKLRYTGEFEDWEILRGVYNAQLMLYGVFFKFFLHSSYADPDLRDPGGGVTVHGNKPMLYASIFQPGTNAWRFQDLNGALHGVDFLPHNFLIEHFRWQDYKKWMDALNTSLEQGKAAFYKLAGDEFLKVKQFFDLGNFTRAGGLDTLGGWRLFATYLDWIRPHMKMNETPDYFYRDKAGNILKDKEGKDRINEDVLMNMWKRVENIGSDVLENLTTYKFLTSPHGGVIPNNIKAGEKKANYKGMMTEHRANVSKLFEFLYDRYLNKDFVGKQFLRKPDGSFFKDSKEFVKYIVDYLDSPDYYKSEKKELLETYLYHTFTVIMFERMPMKFVDLEKRRDTQNGMTLYDELQKTFTGNISERVPTFDQALSDILYVQTQLRLDVIEDMHSLNKKYKGKEGTAELFGRLYDDAGRPINKSEVNKGRGYVIDEKVIEEKLREYFKRKKMPDQEVNKRIDLAKDIYLELKKRVANKPDVAVWEKKIINEGSQEKATAEQKAEKELWTHVRKNKFISRVERFSQLYKDFVFGFSPTTGELAFSFLNYSAIGDETIERKANFCADTAENIKNEFSKFMDYSRDARTKKSLDDVRKKVWEISQKVRMQWGTGDYPENVARLLMKREYYFFRQNDTPSLDKFDINDVNFQLLNWATDQSSSFSEDDTGGPRSGGAQWELSKNEIDREVSKDTGASGLKLYRKYPEEPKRKKSTLGKEAGLLGKIAEKLAGHPIERLGRDWANELSGVAQKHGMRANLKELFKWEILPRLVAAAAIIFLVLAVLGFKKDFSTSTAGAGAH